MFIFNLQPHLTFHRNVSIEGVTLPGYLKNSNTPESTRYPVFKGCLHF